MKKLILERLSKLVEADDDNEVGDDKVDTVRYNKVSDLLDNELINNAAVIRGLWGDSNDTNRSKFRKKKEQEDNEFGSKYQFTEDEIAKIESILLTLNTKIGSVVKPTKDKGNLRVVDKAT